MRDGTSPPLFKLGHEVDGVWRQYSHPPVFARVQAGNGEPKLLAAAPGSDPLVLLTLAECLAPPFLLLYVLHTPRGEGEPGRYQSGELSGAELRQFVHTFADFLSADARFDLWVHSPGDRATVVWDRHDLIYGYGPVEAWIVALRALGFGEGEPEVSVTHEHHYHAALDPLARALLASRDWYRSPLRPEDEQ